MIIEVSETKRWLRLDDEAGEEDETLEMLIGAAESYLLQATGKAFDSSNKQAKLFCLVLVTDWYENRELIGTGPSDKVRFSIQSILTQLQYMPIEGGVNNGEKESIPSDSAFQG
ncbi:head-tail connector protein [Bacillus infantis]|uniref:head-tail connector protein n=1 Tax=Bacillus infantis TaxID=324767 RepID=UPI003CF8D1CB